MIAAMRVSMPMAEFVAWLAGSGLAGLLLLLAIIVLPKRKDPASG